MSDVIIVGIITAVVSLIGIFISAKTTRDEVTHKLDTNQRLTNQQVDFMKEELAEMKSDIKQHNHYAQLFNENIPLMKEQIKVANHRIDDLEAATKKPV